MGHLEYKKKSNRIFSELGCHIHSVYEIYYFVSGDAELMVEGRIFKLTPHSLLIFPPNVLHGIQVNSCDDHVRYCLYISPQDLIPERLHFLTDIVTDTKKAPQELLYEHTEAFRLEQFFYNLKQLEEQPEDIRATFEPIFTESLVAQINLLYHTLRPSRVSHGTAGKIDAIVSYLNLHLTTPMTLDSIADHFFLSKNYLNRTFKEAIGTTVIEYLRYKRVLLARQHILNGETAMNAAILSGFSDYSTFYRTYVKYMNISPHSDIHTSPKTIVIKR